MNFCLILFVCQIWMMQVLGDQNEDRRQQWIKAFETLCPGHDTSSHLINGYVNKMTSDKCDAPQYWQKTGKLLSAKVRISC